MENSAIPGLCEDIIHKLTELKNGDFSMEDTVRLYEVLESISEELNTLVVSNRRALPLPNTTVGGVATPTVIKEAPKQKHYINIWKF